MNSHRPPTLDEVLYDERLTNDQRLAISNLMTPEPRIKTAKIGPALSLFVWLTSGNAYRIDPNGSVWRLG